jgi:hypothetical protein
MHVLDWHDNCSVSATLGQCAWFCAEISGYDGWNVACVESAMETHAISNLQYL